MSQINENWQESGWGCCIWAVSWEQILECSVLELALVALSKVGLPMQLKSPPLGKSQHLFIYLFKLDIYNM